MNKIRFQRERSILMGAADAAYVSADELAIDALAEAVIQGIQTDVEIKLGGVTVFLAMLRDPEHWSEDWEARGITDVDEWLQGLAEQS